MASFFWEFHVRVGSWRRLPPLQFNLKPNPPIFSIGIFFFRVLSRGHSFWLAAEGKPNGKPKQPCSGPLKKQQATHVFWSVPKTARSFSARVPKSLWSREGCETSASNTFCFPLMPQMPVRGGGGGGVGGGWIQKKTSRARLFAAGLGGAICELRHHRLGRAVVACPLVLGLLASHWRFRCGCLSLVSLFFLGGGGGGGARPPEHSWRNEFVSLSFPFGKIRGSPRKRCT